MTIKITTPNGGADSLDFGCAQTAIVATVTGTEVSSGEGKLELKTTTGGTSATKVTVLANGDVGVGTSSPNRRLEALSSQEVVATFESSSATSGRISFSDANTTNDTKVTIGAVGDGMKFNTNGSERMRITSDGDLKFNSGYGSAATAYGCRAWVNFNGTGTVAIRDSGNVSSITDNGTGNYTVNFTVAMVDANYSTSYTPSNNASAVTMGFVLYTAAPTTSSVRVQNAGWNGPLYDSTYNNIGIFR